MVISPRTGSRPAFTLVELLVVVSIIALLISILLPSLRKAREQAKQTVCASHLHSFGRGFFAYAADQNDYLCSGSFDPDVANGRDGPVDRVGWVADLVNAKLGFPATMLCPSNLATSNQKIGHGSGSSGGPAGFYSAVQAADLILHGYNTNYTQAWYMGRTQVKPEGSNSKRLADTWGPLRLTALARVSASRVPLMGDGGIEPRIADGGDESWVPIEGATRAVKSMTDGPSRGIFGPQDYSDFGPAHGFGKKLNGHKASVRDRANILFGDGHVGVFVDKVRNGEFNIIRNAQGEFVQEDLDDGQVFDGVLSLGRRNRGANMDILD